MSSKTRAVHNFRVWKLKKERRRTSGMLPDVIKGIISMFIITAVTMIIIDFFRFPDCYLLTWRYQLKNEIKAGNKQSIEYYQNNYIAHGRCLYDDILIKFDIE